jgi:Sec-independent protein secretion pathway component TatC
MSLLAFPLSLLYFGGILLCKLMPKGRGLLPVDEP